MSLKEGSCTRRAARIAATRSVPIKPKQNDRPSNQKTAAESPSHCDEVKAPVVQKKRGDILSLNDDCLLEIFAYLEMKDLFAVSDASNRFTNLAYQTAEKRLRGGEYVHIPEYESNQRHHIYTKHIEAASMLIKFGPFIRHLQINGQHDFIQMCNGQLFSLWKFGEMLNNCTSLRSLRLKEVELWRVQFAKAKPVLRKIETLEMRHCCCGTRKLVGILRECHKLKHFSLDEHYITLTADVLSSIIQHVNLESLRLKNGFVGGFENLNHSEFTKFVNELRALTQLKKLEIGFKLRELTGEHLSQILAMESLVELELSHFEESNNFLFALSANGNLKVCKLHTNLDLSEELMICAHNFDITVIEEQEYKRTSMTYTLLRKH